MSIEFKNINSKNKKLLIEELKDINLELNDFMPNILHKNFNNKFNYE
jgi:hypothetical protein